MGAIWGLGVGFEGYLRSVGGVWGMGGLFGVKGAIEVWGGLFEGVFGV